MVLFGMQSSLGTISFMAVIAEGKEVFITNCQVVGRNLSARLDKFYSLIECNFCFIKSLLCHGKN